MKQASENQHRRHGKNDRPRRACFFIEANQNKGERNIFCKVCLGSNGNEKRGSIAFVPKLKAAGAPSSKTYLRAAPLHYHSYRETQEQNTENNCYAKGDG